MSRSTSIRMGMIGQVTAGASSEGRHALAGPVVPAMPNVHSHAFQRAIAGRTGRKSRRTGRQLLDVAPGDVCVPRSCRCGFVRGDRRAGVRRDDEGRLHGRRRVPLRPPRRGRQAVRRPGRARVAHRVGRADRRARAHAAAGVLRACGLRRHRRHRGPAPVRAHALYVHAPRRSPARARGRAHTTSWASRRTACAR